MFSMSLLGRVSFPSNLRHRRLQILNILGSSTVPNKLQHKAMAVLNIPYTTSSLSALRTKPFSFNKPTKRLSSSFKTKHPVKTLFPLKSFSSSTIHSDLTQIATPKSLKSFSFSTNHSDLTPIATPKSLKSFSSSTNHSDLTPIATPKSLKSFSSSTNHSDLTPIATPKTLKSRLHSGETLYGLFLLGFSPIFAEIAGLAGYDFVVVDMEHGPGGISEALSCLHALAAARTPAILRVPENCPTWAKKALDLGPQGIMFPLIDNPEAAKKAVSYCRFQPRGRRGSANKIIRTSSYGIDEGYFRNYEDELLIMCQVESVEGVERAEEIAAVDGVDCIQTGPSDLTASMGYLRDPGNKEVRDMIRALEKAVLGVDPKDGGAYLAGMATPFDGPIDLRRRGYHMVSGAVDIGLFRSAAVEDVKRFKMALMEGSDDAAKGKDAADEKYRREREKGSLGCKKL